MQFILIGILAAIGVSLLAYFAGSLNLSGALAAAVLGSLVFGAGGLRWAALLVVFFVSSSGFSRLFMRQKRNLDEKFSRGSRRDAVQVLANGGIAGAFVLLHLNIPHAAWPWMAFAGSLAAVNADTWATELGVLSHSQPRLISTGQPVERGTSGGVTLEGTLAALSGSALIALLAVLLAPAGIPRSIPVFGILLVSGLAGSLLDSLLGATVQAIYYCPACKKETERHPQHLCGGATSRLRGIPWLGNDWVNLACALSGGLVSAVFFLIW